MFKGLFLLFFLTNLARGPVAAPLVVDPVLTSRAQARAELLCDRNQFSHKDWEDSFDNLPYDYEWHGENLAKGSSDMRRVHKALLASPTHKANIVNQHFTDMGLGYDPDCQLTVQLYGG